MDMAELFHRMNAERRFTLTSETKPSAGRVGGRTIDQIRQARSDSRTRLRDLTGRDIDLEPADQPQHLHRGRHFARPDMHAGFEFGAMALEPKVRLFHEIT